MCDRNYSCTSNWNTVSDNYINVAVRFLKDQVRLIDIDNSLQPMFNV